MSQYGECASLIDLPDRLQALAVNGDVDHDLRDLLWTGAPGSKRTAEIGETRPGLAAKPVLIPG